MTRKDATPRMGYIRIERVTGGAASSAALRRAGYWAAYDAGMPDARVELRHEHGESTGDAVNRLHREPSPYKQKKRKGSARVAD